MVTSPAAARKKINETIKSAGNKIRFKFYNFFEDETDYDDQGTLSQSGVDFWTSGLIQPVRGKTNSQEAVLLQQGKLLMGDNRIYVEGSIPTSGIFKLGIGSPVENENYMLEPGVEAWTIGSAVIYKKIFVRILTNGSLTGEV